MKIFRSETFPGVLSAAGLLLLWKAASLFFLRTFLQAPLELAGRIISMFSSAAADLVIGKTLERVFAGLILSMLLGAALGRGMGLRRAVASFFASWIMVLLTFQ